MVCQEDGHVVALAQQNVPENNQVVISAFAKALSVCPDVNCLVYDRACKFFQEAKEKDEFRQVKYFAVDKFHALRHRNDCPCNPLKVLRLKRRLRESNTSVCEQTFAWFRNYARTLNEMRPCRHAFLVLLFVRMHNEMVKTGTNLGNPFVHKRATVFKRPAAGTLRGRTSM